MKARIAFVFGITSLLGLSAAGQSGTSRLLIRPPYSMPAVTGMPYSAELTEERQRTLADGTHISEPTWTSKMFRDSAGRTRTERSEAMVEIYDVVAGYRYILDTANKIAHRSAIPPRLQSQIVTGSASRATAGTQPAPPKAADTPRRPETIIEQLGKRFIEGLTCEGTLRKTTYPAGFMGNDRPISTTDENWFSKDLQLWVLQKLIDPYSLEERTLTMKNVSRVEPEYSLFQPPPDYEVVDEAGSFELVIKH